MATTTIKMADLKTKVKPGLSEFYGAEATTNAVHNQFDDEDFAEDWVNK